MVVSNTLQNLWIDVQGSGSGAKPGGEPLERTLTISNRGDRAANIELWLEPADARSEPLLRWSQFDRSVTDLRLEPGESADVRLTFRVPPQADPGFYSYDIRVSSDQYLGEDIRRSQQLQVLPSAQELELRNEPKIVVSPASDSEHPILLAAGTTLTIKVMVENPSRRTDRFSLFCPDLPADWYEVDYPERSLDLPGVVRQTAGLELNPKQSGEILLHVHPPAYTPAKDYFPTLHVRSHNRSNLALLEIIYLTIPADDRLTIELQPEGRKIPSADESFEITLVNLGNVERHLMLSAQDFDRLFNYAIEPAQIQLLPGEQAIAQLLPYPKHWWRKIWRLNERTVTFQVELQNVWPLVDLTEVPEAVPIAPPQPQWLPGLPETLPQGRIVWQARRRWLFHLLIALLSLGLLAAVVALIWYFFFWRPSLRPRILVFESAQETYQEETDETIELDWEITNPYDIDRIVLLRGQADKQSVLQTLETDPDALQNYWFNRPNKGGLPPDLSASDPETPTTSAEALSQGSCAIVEISEAERSLLTPLFRLHRHLFRAESPNEKRLRCTNVQVQEFLTEGDALTEGQYAFTLMVFQKTRQSDADSTDEVTAVQELGPLSDTAFLEKVAVAPAAPPQILEFSATASEYRFVDEALIQPPNPTLGAAELLAAAAPESEEAGSAAAQAEDTPVGVEGTQSGQAIAPISEPDVTPTVPIRLSWTITNLKDIEALKLVSLAPDGSENMRPITFDGFDLSAAVDDFNRLDPRLRPYCLSRDNQLVCEAVPTPVTQVGEYTFYLTVMPKRDDVTEAITSSTPTIPIKPPKPDIVEFQVNGESVAQKPKFVYAVNPARESFDIRLSWQVEHATQVELLPAPGEIDRQDTLYTLSAAPGAEKITLRAVNELGEEVTRSVVIEKVEYSARPSAQSGNGQPPPLPTVPIPSLPPAPSRLPPLELPPQAD
ncbi:MAG: hypothetical protein F6K04_13585 [Leptolyngbya sp. SIO4C5]|nr:hypothetical protein [Leptolyngbya sp. SIO4C5]